VTVAYDALLASATPDFVVLAEVQPMERLNSWTAAGGGLTNTYYCRVLDADRDDDRGGRDLSAAR
jgi:hypothetical protein